jgi:hypothetical protein
MLKKFFIVLGVFVTAVLVAAAFKSPEMKVTRNIVVAAAPEAIFPYINNSKKAYEWMPWADGDPGIEINFSGAAEGVGAISSWSGKQMGVGNSEVVESVPNQVVKTKLSYTKPFEMSQMAEISLSPAESGTKVTWSVSGHNNFFFRVMGLFMNCDKMIGGEFEKGLGRLKALAESSK